MTKTLIAFILFVSLTQGAFAYVYTTTEDFTTTSQINQYDHDTTALMNSVNVDSDWVGKLLTHNDKLYVQSGEFGSLSNISIYNPDTLEKEQDLIVNAFGGTDNFTFGVDENIYGLSHGHYWFTGPNAGQVSYSIKQHSGTTGDYLGDFIGDTIFNYASFTTGIDNIFYLSADDEVSKYDIFTGDYLGSLFDYAPGNLLVNDDYLFGTYDGKVLKYNFATDTLDMDFINASGFLNFGMNNDLYVNNKDSGFIEEYDVTSGSFVRNYMASPTDSFAFNDNTTAVPEPASMMMLLLGLFGFGIFRRKESRK